ncbi:hypothetical protein HMPREF9525_00719 [Enterococcus faecium TX0133a04]|nr:hypothetical protein HMPREF9523_01195 [Enterococcus faecium TX0133A]EFR78053.1 hypothetical protein HMPREF9527_01074 [Enterococcus faecium TX0133C]EFS07213.1 hypothetical protein HMPREF9525_00719 [Enterococcus faecium TX0133a04]
MIRLCCLDSFFVSIFRGIFFFFFVRAVRLRQDKLVGKKERNVYT